MMRLLLLLVAAGFCAAAVPAADAVSLSFEDVDYRTGSISGVCTITRATAESTIQYYSLYFSKNATGPAEKLIIDLGYPHAAIVDNIALPSLSNPAHPAGFIRVLVPPTPIPTGAKSLIVVSKNSDGERSLTNSILPLLDVTMAPKLLCRNTTLTHPSGAFDDGSGDANYTSAVDSPSGFYHCIWNISNPTVEKFLFRVTYLKLDDYDSLCMYDGASSPSAASLIECYTAGTGAAKPYNVVSRSNTMQVVLNVTGSVSGDGFRAVYFGLVGDEFENTVSDSVLKIQYDQDMPVGCHCMDVTCQGQPAHCFVDQGNGKGMATCDNLETCPP